MRGAFLNRRLWGSRCTARNRADIRTLSRRWSEVNPAGGEAAVVASTPGVSAMPPLSAWPSMLIATIPLRPLFPDTGVFGGVTRQRSVVW